jgi:preprotein translocase subunit SecE
LVEHWSPKPGVGSSSLSTRAINKILIARKMLNYIQESFNELKNHVTWTSWSEAQRLTVLVAVFSIILALAIWGVDTVFSKIIAQYFEWIKA